MKYSGQGPGFGPPGPFPAGQFGSLNDGQIPAPMPPAGQFGPPGPTPGGSIRNTLGSGLKSSGVFQKDGQLTNLRGGFFGPKQVQPYGQPLSQYMPPAPVQGGLGSGTERSMGGGKMSKGPFSFLGSGGPGPVGYAPRQLILQPAGEGIIGNGIATISPDNSFMLVANLPPPHSFLGQGQGMATYAVYLVDKKGQNGFLAGTLRPVGSGVYQANFHSTVPLTPYERAVISVENPQYVGQVPAGPIILKVREPVGPAALLNPAKKAGGTVWSKISGLFRGKAAAPLPVEPAAIDGAGDQ